MALFQGAGSVTIGPYISYVSGFTKALPDEEIKVYRRAGFALMTFFGAISVTSLATLSSALEAHCRLFDAYVRVMVVAYSLLFLTAFVTVMLSWELQEKARERGKKEGSTTEERAAKYGRMYYIYVAAFAIASWVFFWRHHRG